MNFKSVIFVVMIVTGVLLLACGSDKQAQSQTDSNARLELANAYQNNGLYQAAVDEYLVYLAEYPVEPERRANTYYTIANIYFDRLNDYEKALEYYFKIKYLYPESNLQGETGKKIVNCLERLHRSMDAARVMEKEASLDQEAVAESRPGQVLADLGDRKITQGDLDFQVTKLPPYMQDQFKNKETKKQLLQQLIAEELLYESAKRKGLDKDKDVIEASFQAQRALMVQKLLQDELQDKINIQPEDVELFYMAHKDMYVEKDSKGNVKRQKPFEEVAQRVAQDLAMDRQQQESQKIIERLMQTKKVKIYENRIR
ncbi:MAG: SurA N-terminal domain-containing protein [Calditrichaceae bacterium]|nr:SurA N-terminal domain-containing protein [Calditrichaceae bacterium]